MSSLIVLPSVCVMLLATGVWSEGDEESLRLAWAVRKLVRNCSNDAQGEYVQKPAKLGPSGPNGESRMCECDMSHKREIVLQLREMEETIKSMKFKFPEGFCLLGMKSGEIPDSAISASSDHSASYCEIANSRLDRYGAWCTAGLNPPHQWIEVDLGKIRNITGVVTQGALYTSTLYEWVTAFKVEFGTEFGVRQSLIENGRSKIFSPVNFDATTKVVSRFPHSITARYVRIVPTGYKNHISMRFDLIDC